VCVCVRVCVCVCVCTCEKVHSQRSVPHNIFVSSVPCLHRYLEKLSGLAELHAGVDDLDVDWDDDTDDF
jgi:hypothetical protein